MPVHGRPKGELSPVPWQAFSRPYLGKMLLRAESDEGDAAEMADVAGLAVLHLDRCGAGGTGIAQDKGGE